MPMPFVYAVGAVASGIGAVSPGLPAGTVAGDLLVLFLENQDATAVPAVTGYTEITNANVPSGSLTRLSVRWKRAGPSEAGPTIPDPGDHVVARIVGLRGCVPTGNPWLVAATTTELAADTTVSIPGATTVFGDCLILAAFSTGTDVASTTHATGWANASLGAVTEVADNWVVDGLGGGFAVASGTYASRGTYSATTATCTTAQFKALVSVAFLGAGERAGPYTGPTPGYGGPTGQWRPFPVEGLPPSNDLVTAAEAAAGDAAGLDPVPAVQVFAECAAATGVGQDATAQSATTGPFNNNAEGGSNGVTVTTGNSGGASGDAFTGVTGSPTFTTAQSYDGSLAYDVTTAGGTAHVSWTYTAVGRSYGAVAFRVDNAATPRSLVRIMAAGVQVARIAMVTGSVIRLSDANANATVASSGAIIASSTWYWLQWDITVGTSATGTVWVYDSTNTLLATVTGTGNFGTANADQTIFGHVAATTATTWLDMLNANSTALPRLLQPAGDSAGTASAGDATASAGAQAEAGAAGAAGLDATAQIQTDLAVTAGPAAATAVGHDATTASSVPAGPAAATAVGNAATTAQSVNADQAAASGVGNTAAPTITTDVEHAAATAAGQNPSTAVQVFAEAATATAAGLDATASAATDLQVTPGVAAATAVGQDATAAISVNADQAAAAGVGQNPSTAAGASADQAAATAVGQQASTAAGVLAEAAATTATGLDAAPSVGVSADQSAATATGYDATASGATDLQVPAGLAAVTGTGQDAAAQVSVNADQAAATGVGQNPIPAFGATADQAAATAVGLDAVADAPTPATANAGPAAATAVGNSPAAEHGALPSSAAASAVGNDSTAARAVLAEAAAIVAAAYDVASSGGIFKAASVPAVAETRTSSSSATARRTSSALVGASRSSAPAVAENRTSSGPVTARRTSTPNVQ